MYKYSTEIHVSRGHENATRTQPATAVRAVTSLCRVTGVFIMSRLINSVVVFDRTNRDTKRHEIERPFIPPTLTPHPPPTPPLEHTYVTLVYE